MKKIIGIILTIIGSIVAISGLILKIKDQISTVIIGKADGPTSIFIAGKIGDALAVIGIFAGIILIIVGIAVIARKK